jgi:PLP dependent protein
LLQIYIAQEETKFGLSETEAIELLNSNEMAAMQNIRIVGLMGMASNTDDQAQVRQEFKNLKQLYDQLKTNNSLSPNIILTELSMGMSGDYLVAAQEGSTLVRVGSAIFGGR